MKLSNKLYHIQNQKITMKFFKIQWNYGKLMLISSNNNELKRWKEISIKLELKMKRIISLQDRLMKTLYLIKVFILIRKLYNYISKKILILSLGQVNLQHLKYLSSLKPREHLLSFRLLLENRFC